MTTVTERRIVREASEGGEQVPAGPAARAGGILKGGKMWRTPSQEGAPPNALPEPSPATASPSMSPGSPTDDNDNRPMVRFTEEELAERSAASGAESDLDKSSTASSASAGPAAAATSAQPQQQDNPGEVTLQFRIGSRLLKASSLMQPSSAVRQLFPGSLGSADGDDEEVEVPLPLPYLLTADTLRTLDGTRRYRKTGDSDGQPAGEGTLRRAIERNTLRRSLLLKSKHKQRRQDSLVERIRQLTCDVDGDLDGDAAAPTADEQRPELEGTSDTSADGERTSPQGEEQAALPPPPGPPTSLPPAPTTPAPLPPLGHIKTSSASANSSVSSTYKRLSDLFGRRSQEKGNHQVSEQGRVGVVAWGG